MARSERFEMRLTKADRALLDALRGRSSRSAYMVGLLHREGRRQGAVGTDKPSSRDPE